MLSFDKLTRLRVPVLSFSFLVVFYLWLSRGMGSTSGTVVFGVLAAVYLIWPNTALLLVTPGLLPTVGLDLGLGRSPFPIIVTAAFVGQCCQGQWSLTMLRRARWTANREQLFEPSHQGQHVGVEAVLVSQAVLYGWLLLLLALAVSTAINDRDFYPQLLVWVVRCVLMLTYVSAWQHSWHPEYGFWGWIVAGILMVPAAAIIYNATGSVLAIRTGLEVMGQGDMLSVMYLLLSVSGFLVVSFWCVWALQSRGLLSSVVAYVLSAAFASGLLFSGRRQALLGMLLSLGLYALANPLKKSGRVLVASAISLCFICYCGLLTEFMEGRESIRDELAGRGTGRLSLYGVGVDAFFDRPVLGWGLDSYSDITLSHGLVSKRRRDGGASHNTFIGVAVEAGTPGLMGVLLVVVGAMKPTLRLARMAHRVGPGPWTYTFPILGFVVAGALVSRVIEDNWYLLGLAMLCGAGGRLARDGNPIEGGIERVQSGVCSVCTQDRRW